MNKLTVFVISLTISTNVFADWIKLGENERSTIYIHTNFKKADESRVAWMLFNYKATQISPLSGRRYLTEKAQWEIKCNTEKMRILAATWHSKNMGDGMVVYTMTKPSEWFPTSAPKSFANAAWSYTCAKRQ